MGRNPIQIAYSFGSSAWIGGVNYMLLSNPILFNVSANIPHPFKISILGVLK